jgi:hypothetical protein
MRDFENRCIRVRVDGYNRLRGTHASQVLDSARDPDGDVQIWTYGLSGLSDLGE